MDIIRVDSYYDNRFSQKILNQKGCFLLDNEFFEVEIISRREAVIRGSDKEKYKYVIERFMYYSPHITKYYDELNNLIIEYPKKEIICIPINKIQPSQFYIDEDKIKAISTFIDKKEDIIIQVMKWKDIFISLDGHTRLFYAIQNGWDSVYTVIEEDKKWALDFVKEAQKRNIYSIKDLKILSHYEYEINWYKFCNNFLGNNI